jgi:hypothetical protein
MYNYSAKLTYQNSDNDTVYRKELLDCFDLKEYDDSINDTIGVIYKQYGEKYNNIFSSLKDTKYILFTNLSDADLFIVLFSWEYWFENHLFLQSLQNENLSEIKLCEQQLLNKIVGLGK